MPRHSPFGTLLSRTLPKYTGPFHVGVYDMEIPVNRQTFGSFTHKEMPNRTAGIALDTVLFSLFYPCEKPEKPKPVAWFPKYVSISVFMVSSVYHGHVPFMNFFSLSQHIIF